MLGGHSASRKLGGPEMYKVARRALTAGLPGNRKAKILDVRLEPADAPEATLCALRARTSEQFW